MAEKIQFELVSPAKLLLSEPVEMVVVPGEDGDFGALPLHAPLISTVRPGVIDIHNDGKVTNRIFVAGGFAEVTGERVTVLAEEAFPLDELTSEIAAERRAAADLAVTDAQTDLDRSRAARQVAIAEAMVVALR
ncbi:ATP synthase F1 subunit epsilon [Magnetospirillum fulvum]|jgi:F-type H+-transporting ATPase subunit epsilon|uniref:ATP synthase epsilon chain n=1 Tax=Magnetospirillum fulvum MGU-K5 TaxID=1316936 RepID=S9SBK2_MAGFU|nr:ATP synthase F1 subunit epsilon [Magnetospirillum fulvum]EPY03292.1 ATP synthase epsilon chain [Magnetospirillum fulvum MGU-K5]